MIGAIVLTLRHRKDVKRQDILAQIYRDPDKSVSLKNVKPGQGLWNVDALFSQKEFQMITLEHYLTVAAVLFIIGIFGLFLNRKNVIILLMSIEIMLLSVNINLVAFSSFMNDLVGQIFTLFVLTVAAAEAAIGLAILVSFFRNRGTIAVEDANVMKG